jgi:photosystem II stability/assembly factor-like uncharacterized protein
MKKLLILLVLLMLFLILTNLQAQQWQSLNMICKSDLSSVCYPGQNKAYILGKDGTLLSTSDRGLSWREQNLPTSAGLHSIYFLNEMSGYVVGDLGKIFKTDLYGLIWNDVSVQSKFFLKDIIFRGTEIGIIAGALKLPIDEINYFLPAILCTYDGGMNWQEVIFDGDGRLNSVAITQDLLVVAVGEKGRIVASNDGGKNWREIESEITANLNEVKVCPDGQILIVGDEGKILIFNRDNWTLKEISTNSFYNIKSICFKGSGKLVVAADKHVFNERAAVILQSDNMGADWLEIYNSEENNFNCIAFCNPQYAFAVGDKGNVVLYNESSLVKEPRKPSTKEFIVFQNYPNPFNPTTTIGYVLQENSNARLTLLNSLGEEIALLVNEEQDKGYHKVEFDGSKLSSAVYFYKLVAKDFVSVKKMMLVK